MQIYMREILIKAEKTVRLHEPSLIFTIIQGNLLRYCNVKLISVWYIVGVNICQPIYCAAHVIFLPQSSHELNEL